MNPKAAQERPAPNGQQANGQQDSHDQSQSGELVDEASPRSRGEAFHVVGIGASAGGLEALEQFFGHVAPGSGMAYVVVQHLSPDFESVMDELLSRHTSLKIERVRESVKVQPNTIYLNPPDKVMVVDAGGVLRLQERDHESKLHLPIDTFLTTLAEHLGRRAIAIILSGTGSDGSRGIRAVHEKGGLVISQSQESAKFDGMPRSAIETGLVDVALAPLEMPQALARYAQHPRATELIDQTHQADQADQDDSTFSPIFRMLQEDFGIDFSYYNPSTVRRRVERRVLLTRTEDLSDYMDRLARDPLERNSLYRDLLIGVTRFFRDAEAFQRLERELHSYLAARPDPEEEVRIWVAGCATGEEAYTIAILLREAFERLNQPVNAKIFATDMHPQSLETASAGVYDADKLAQMSPQRLQRYFVRDGDRYQVTSELRKMIVFAAHNVVRDAPFTRLDLVTCRNLLIYFKPPAQQKALSLFQFALKMGGLLMLGPSEGLGPLADQFSPVHESWKIYRKHRECRLPAEASLPVGGGVKPPPRRDRHATRRRRDLSDSRLLQAYDSLLADQTPPSVLIDANREIVHTFAGAGVFFRRSDGRSTNDVVATVAPELRTPLSAALDRCARHGESLAFLARGVPLGKGARDVQMRVKPIPVEGANEPWILVSFETRDPHDQSSPASESTTQLDLDDASRERLEYLESELDRTRDQLHNSVENMETANEELQATNEELLASNEELQSTNEELHSVNEELYTVNAEYQKKIAELTELSDDVDNLLRSTEVGTIFLDQDLCIRKFTPAVYDCFPLLASDVGRPITSFSHNLEYDQLVEDLTRLLEQGETVERQVRTKKGAWYLLRVLPYKRQRKADAGVVITLTDISKLKRAEEEAREAVSKRDRFLAMLSHELRNPLGAVLNAIYVMQRAPEDPATLERSRQVIYGQANQMARLLDDLLDVSRITQGKIELRRELFDVRDAAREAIESVRPRFEARRQQFSVDLPDEPLLVEGDRARIQQMQVNLLTNASKYTPEEGRIEMSWEAGGDKAILVVRDTGEGIPPEMVDRIFEMFVQSDNTLDRSDGGMGVGLTLVKSIVELHGGEICAHSEGLGKGSEFAISLPLTTRTPAAPSHEPSSSSREGQRARMIIIEDNDDSREMLATLLEYDGFAVDAAADGLTGVKMIEEKQYDMALVDIGLPGIDGFEVARRVRRMSRREGRHCPTLVALTGYGQEKDREAVFDAGFDEHLVKPLQPDQLHKVLATKR